MTIEKLGRRYYFNGNTYAVRDQLRSDGCHWDAERKQWWTSKSDVADKYREAAPAPYQAPTKDELSRLPCSGKANYKGRSYYVVGRSKAGDKYHLTVLDCSIDFWAPISECTWEKSYEPRMHRGQAQARTVGGIRRFIEQQQNPETARGECYECGEWGPKGERCRECHEGCHV